MMYTEVCQELLLRREVESLVTRLHGSMQRQSVTACGANQFTTAAADTSCVLPVVYLHLLIDSSRDNG